MHLSKLRVGMMGLEMPGIAHPVAKFPLLGSIERDPPWAATIELARFDDAAFNPVIDDVYADPKAFSNLLHGEFFRSPERN